MGTSWVGGLESGSIGGGAPDEAAVAGFVGPQRDRARDDRSDGERAEIAAIQAVRDGRVHEEDFVRPKHATAAPARQRTAEMIAIMGDADLDMIDGDDIAVPAHDLSG